MHIMNFRDVEIRNKCPKCGSDEYFIKTPNIYVKSLGRHVKLLRCKKCFYRFREVIIIKRQVDSSSCPNLFDNYLNVTSLKTLKNVMGSQHSKATLHRWLVKNLDNYPTWKERLPIFSKKYSHIMGIDATGIRIRKKMYYYLHIVDFPNNHLAYEILERKNIEDIKAVLYEIKSAGYAPTVVVTDRAKELVNAIREVFPNAIIQGCLFHLKLWLNKKLPIKFDAIYSPQDELWKKIKVTIIQIASAANDELRQRYVKGLKSMLVPVDARVMRVVNSFFRDLTYYHTMQELSLFGCKSEWRYNNVCERAMRSVKNLSCKMSGFKNLVLAKKYINAMWAVISNRNDLNVMVFERCKSVQQTLSIFCSNDIAAALIEQ